MNILDLVISNRPARVPVPGGGRVGDGKGQDIHTLKGFEGEDLSVIERPRNLVDAARHHRVNWLRMHICQ